MHSTPIFTVNIVVCCLCREWAESFDCPLFVLDFFLITSLHLCKNAFSDCNALLARICTSFLWFSNNVRVRVIFFSRYTM